MQNYDYDILLINPPLLYIKDKLAQFGSLHLTSGVPYKTFNPGILSIGTYLDWKGYKVKICDITKCEETEGLLKETLNFGKPMVVGISCSYGQSYLPTLQIAQFIKNWYPDVFIVTGGQHSGLIGGIALKDCNAIDVVSRYEGEITLLQLLEYRKGLRSISEINGIVFRRSELEREKVSINDNIIPFKFNNLDYDCSIKTVVYDEYLENPKTPNVVDLNEMPFLKYDLYPNYLSYPPYVEESRGCSWGCEYCVSCFINSRRLRKKESKRFISELKHCVSIYGKDNQYPILASNFGVDDNNTINICEGIKNNFGSLKWVSEFRTDLKWENYIDAMYESGCKAFAVGIESANNSILRLMNKTVNPVHYLEKAEKLITYLKKYSDSIMHINLMFYIGESPETVKNNIAFIMKWINDIHSIHYSPVIAYPGTRLWNNMESYNEKYGTTIIKNDLWDSMHFYPVNPSKYFSYEDAGHFSRMMEKLILKEEQFYIMHETRFSKDKDGKIPDEYRNKFIGDILYSG
ncbi:radical SAM superfamily enzyme YgiQ (UPF0313 family) [Anaerobacterium chartisolvens]|uniref:Radical SAM superfamily enzyme YgiQ (UPF0313 family) n=1 Tax=Anaerobacterium chartisolvens TaxID=1297424 RepID=A0A369BKB0_9FIRM|nr:radical SAM protein [Anaerobacterium chartisolvens]RCX21016.1 radical SAM superfamily enzyme YgiQ (UPF0313 family) [Anaerobacterium chartisolvens]